MSTSSVHLQISGRGNSDVAVSASLWRKWKLEADEFYAISFGGRKIIARLERTKGNADLIILPGGLARDLMVPHSKKVRAAVQGKTIRIGPLIGLLNDRSEKSKKLFEKMLLSDQPKEHFAFIFTPRDVDWTRGRVTGEFLTEGGQWGKQAFPIPDVIYNRISTRKREKSETVQYLYNNIDLKGIPKMFNPRFFSKKEIHYLLKDHPDTKAFMPETIFAPSYDELSWLIDKYNEVYFKPNNGTEGWGIYKITKNKAGYSCNTERTISRYATLENLLKDIDATKKRLRYLAQQSIPLIQLNGSYVDFRVNINKNKDDKWVVAGIAAKAAGEKSVTTHARLGGKIYTGNEILSSLYKEQAGEMRSKIEGAAVILAETIESQIGKHVGELGLDIGIDSSGHIWMFEANSKPGRTVFEHPGLKEASKNSIKYLLEYAHFLAGFN